MGQAVEVMATGTGIVIGTVVVGVTMVVVEATMVAAEEAIMVAAECAIHIPAEVVEWAAVGVVQIA